MLQRAGGKNKPRNKNPLQIDKLSPLKSIVFDTIFRAFIKGLSDYKIQKEILKNLNIPNRSLHYIYILIEKIRRTKTNYERFQNEKIKIKEFTFFRDIIYRLIFYI